MPIRFRCAYCNQLMGISTRKAGKVVSCPKCAGEIIVPVPDGMQAPEVEPSPPAPAQVFEDVNFAQQFSASANSAAAAPDTLQPQIEVEPIPVPAPPRRLGVFLSLGMLLLCFGFVVLLLIFVFVVGLVIGRYTAAT